MNEAAESILLQDYLKRLRLPTMLRDYPECARQAQETKSSFESFLLDLANRELEQRQANQLKRRLKEARFPVLKTLEQTDLSKWPGLDAQQLRVLSGCEWINRRENIALIGKHGAGKSHAATALAVEACRQGHRTLFSTAAQLVNQLIEAREEKQLQKVLKRLERFSLLVIDELGYIPFSEQGAQLLFQVFADRYERGSVLVTSNLLCGAPHKRFNAECIVMRALMDESPHLALS